jgi:hypothetical protein
MREVPALSEPAVPTPPVHVAAWMVAWPLPEKVRNRNRSPGWCWASVVVPLTHMALPLGQTATFCWKNQMPTVAEPFGEKRVEPK